MSMIGEASRRIEGLRSSGHAQEEESPPEGRLHENLVNELPILLATAETPSAGKTVAPAAKQIELHKDCDRVKVLNKQDNASAETCAKAMHLCATDENIQKNCVRTCACGGDKEKKIAAAARKKAHATAEAEQKAQAARET